MTDKPYCGKRPMGKPEGCVEKGFCSNCEFQPGIALEKLGALNLTYAKQRRIEELIEALLAEIGVRSRGRIEFNREGGEEHTGVIEFESCNNGKWKSTGWHAMGGDGTFSIFDAFRKDGPCLRKIREVLAKYD